jgi:hypothetical protein
LGGEFGALSSPGGQRQPQVSELAVQLLGECLVEQRSELSETIDVEADTSLLGFATGDAPVGPGRYFFTNRMLIG